MNRGSKYFPGQQFERTHRIIITARYTINEESGNREKAVLKKLLYARSMCVADGVFGAEG